MNYYVYSPFPKFIFLSIQSEKLTLHLIEHAFLYTIPRKIELFNVEHLNVHMYLDCVNVFRPKTGWKSWKKDWRLKELSKELTRCSAASFRISRLRRSREEKAGNSNARRKQANAKIRNRQSTVFQIFSIRLGSIIKRKKDYNTQLDNYKKINNA